MAWTNHGVIFKADGQNDWMMTHTAMPMALSLGGDRYRIYFGSRNEKQSPAVSFIEIDLTQPTHTLAISAQPVLQAGKPGYFDDNGLYPGAILRDGNKVYMYYMGRSNGQHGLYYMAIGLAVSHDDGLTFEKVFPAPVMDRNRFDPWMVTTPWVLKDGDKWRMWYTSGIGWNADLTTSYYHIKYTESADGINWQASETVALGLEGDETNIAAPSVIKDATGQYHMWFSYVPDKTQSYRLGYATSADGICWQRHEPGVNAVPVSSGNWDDKCMAYPCVFEHRNQLYMLYSGNELGKSGIGLASRAK